MANDDAGRRAHRVLTLALRRPVTMRASFIRDACRDDPELASLTPRLLQAARGPDDDPLDVPAVQTADLPSRGTSALDTAEEDDDEAGGRPGNYCLIRVLGAGGSAVVYEATQDRPRRSVAVKVMRRGLTDADAAARFQLETELLARLRHPGIAQIFEAGVWERDDGVATPFYAMELVPQATPMTEHARQFGLDRRARIELFLQACDAVQQGHSLGVIHRDLKPANLLVGPDGRAKVIDFGIARSGGHAGPGITAEATPGAVLGTMHYMSPEQCHPGTPITTRCDVYSLGVVLYELLCERLPHDLSNVPLPEALRRIREDEPVRPRDVVPMLRGDLDAIITMALAKDPEQRYHSASALAADLRRWLNDEAVEARPPSVSAQFRRFARRHKALAMSAAAVAIAATVAVVVSLSFARRASLEANSRRQAEQRAVAEREAALQSAYVANLSAGFAAMESGDVREVRRRLDDAPASRRGWEWRLLRNLSRRDRQVIAAFDGMIFAADGSPDDRRIVTATSHGELGVFDLVTGAKLSAIELPNQPRIFDVALSTGGTIACAGESGVWLWGGRNDDEPTLIHPSGAFRVAWLRDGSLLAVTNGGGAVRLDDGGAKSVLGGPVGGIAVSTDGSRLATYLDDGTIRVWSADSLELLNTFELVPGVTSLAFNGTGDQLAAGATWGIVAVWDLETGERVHDFTTPGGQSSVRTIAFSPDGNHLAVGQIDRRIFQYDLGSPTTEPELILGHEEAVSHLAYTHDGRELWSASWDGTLRSWALAPELRTDLVRELHAHEGEALSVAWSPDGKRLATTGRDRSPRLWDPLTGKSVATLAGHTDGVYEIVFSSDGTQLATASNDGTVRLWTADGEPVRVIDQNGSTAPMWSVAFNADASHLAAAGDEGVVRVFQTADGTMLSEWTAHRRRITSLVLHPDGRRLATASRDGSVRLWDATDGSLLIDFKGHTSDVFSVIFSDDGKHLITGSRDQSVRVWDVDTGQCVQRLSGHGQFITDLDLSPDGTRLAAGSWFGRILVWDTPTWTPVASIKGDGVAVRSVAFSPDGNVLAAATHSGVVRLFDGTFTQP